MICGALSLTASSKHAKQHGTAPRIQGTVCNGAEPPPTHISLFLWGLYEGKALPAWNMKHIQPFFKIKSKGVSLLFDGEMELQRRVRWRCRPEVVRKGKQTVLC